MAILLGWGCLVSDKDSLCWRVLIVASVEILWSLTGTSFVFRVQTYRCASLKSARLYNRATILDDNGCPQPLFSLCSFTHGGDLPPLAIMDNNKNSHSHEGRGSGQFWVVSKLNTAQIYFLYLGLFFLLCAISLPGMRFMIVVIMRTRLEQRTYRF